MADLKSQEPTQVLDVLGRVCPYPLVITKKTIEKASNGTLLKVLCDAPASAEDTIPKYCDTYYGEYYHYSCLHIIKLAGF